MFDTPINIPHFTRVPIGKTADGKEVFLNNVWYQAFYEAVVRRLGGSSNYTVSSLADLTATDGGVIIGDGANFVVESGSTARASLDVPSNAQAVLQSLINAKGDLIVGSADNTAARLGVSTDGFVLTLDSGESLGVKWAAAAGGSSENFYDYVTSLLHFDGTDGATTFTDEKGVTWTANGNAQLDTAQFKFGTASLLLDGTGDFVTAADAAGWHFKSDFTIECWIRLNSTTGTQTIAGQWGGAGTRSWLLQLTSTSLSLACSTTGTNVIIVSGTTSFSTNTWYHIAAVRFANIIYLFVDGVMIASANTVAGFFFNSSLLLYIGMNDDGDQQLFNGWIDEFRITNGVARYTREFTPASAAFGEE